MADGEVYPNARTMSEPVDPTEEPFDAPVRRSDPAADNPEIEALVINLEGYEGPLDVLLDLARAQKVDLRKVSMAALVDQYLAFVAIAKQKDLELAADYLVMAAWLAYLKSRLLLPQTHDEGDEPTGDEMAARLAFQLQRLEAMRTAAEALQTRPQLGQEFFARGAPEGVRVVNTPEWQADLYELLQAYTRQRIATVDRDYHIAPPAVFTVESARTRLSRILGSIPEWTELALLSQISDVDAPGTSVVASSFIAALEFAKDGKVDMRQLDAFAPIYIRARTDDPTRDQDEEPSE
ncbi:MAG: ScpA family protein [Pseudomonadota bacterium]